MVQSENRSNGSLWIIVYFWIGGNGIIDFDFFDGRDYLEQSGRTQNKGCFIPMPGLRLKIFDSRFYSSCILYLSKHRHKLGADSNKQTFCMKCCHTLWKTWSLRMRRHQDTENWSVFIGCVETSPVTMWCLRGDQSFLSPLLRYRHYPLEICEPELGSVRAATCSREATESELSDCKEESQALKPFPDTLVRVRPTAQKLIQSINVITVNNNLAITVMTWTLIFRDFNI